MGPRHHVFKSAATELLVYSLLYVVGVNQRMENRLSGSDGVIAALPAESDAQGETNAVSE